MSCAKSVLTTEQQQQKSTWKGLDATSGAQLIPLCHYGQEGFFICTHHLNCPPNVVLLHPPNVQGTVET